MLAYIKGLVVAKEQGSVIIEANSLGYEILLNSRLLEVVTVGQELELYLHHRITEGHQALYGFSSLSERKLFLMLISVSGVGPKAGLAFLTAYSLEQAVQALAAADLNLISSISGIGRKTAEKIVLELKDKVSEQFTTVVAETNSSTVVSTNHLDSSFQDELTAALRTLGYSSGEIATALKKASAELVDSTNVEEAIKLLLKRI